MGTRLDDVLAKMKAFKDQLKQVSQDLDGTRTLLQAVAKKVDVNDELQSSWILCKYIFVCYI